MTTRLASFFILALGAASTVCSQSNDLPKEFRQVIPRGRIAAIRQPQFVSASEASLGDDSYVLGVVIDGQERAYSLTLLNSHEIVNDQIGTTAFAAVW